MSFLAPVPRSTRTRASWSAPPAPRWWCARGERACERIIGHSVRIAPPSLRGCAMSAVSEAAVGDELPPLSVRVTRADLVRYAGAAQDFNPIHWNERVAAEVGLPDVIAHGMLTMALGGRLV